MDMLMPTFVGNLELSQDLDVDEHGVQLSMSNSLALPDLFSDSWCHTENHLDMYHYHYHYHYILYPI